VLRLTDEAMHEVKEFSRKLILTSFNELSGIYFRRNKSGLQKTCIAKNPSDLSFDLRAKAIEFTNRNANQHLPSDIRQRIKVFKLLT